jgi:hypothetical protein
MKRALPSLSAELGRQLDDMAQRINSGRSISIEEMTDLLDAVHAELPMLKDSRRTLQ